MTDFGSLLSSLMRDRDLGVRALARKVPCDPALISRLGSGQQRPSPQIARGLDDILDAGGELYALAMIAAAGTELPVARLDDDLAAVEVSRRAGASDIGHAAVERLEQVTDSLAVAYASTRPADLLARAKTYLDYVTRLLGGRMTLTEHRRLLVTTAWLSLLAATILTDLGRLDASTAHLRTAMQIASEADHDELRAWCLETRAWQLLITGHYRNAAAAAIGAQTVAPAGSDAAIQSTAQEGRAWARLGAVPETLDALQRVETLVSPLRQPDWPEHHYRYDPAKAEAYLATTLAWVGDPAAEGYARAVLTRIEAGTDSPKRQRRAATARLDLALALVAATRTDEAAGTAREAIESGLLVSSHMWRVREVIGGVADRDPATAAELRSSLAAIGDSKPGTIGQQS